ncbi:MAG: hypothetical protein K0S67_71 [Nitrososphaeraceae archaeon]|nr:hypothetical protein [Nitrososphaeraceae archaeon]MDF2768311.1 hypothetical protein [Nitrososphaeraceae archaeon]
MTLNLYLDGKVGIWRKGMSSDTRTRSRYLAPPVIIILLILMYIGPYAFVYGRTATWTLPRIDERDFDAFDGVEPSVSQVANLTSVKSVEGAQEATYLVKVGVLDRKFLDWIGFPLVLEVNDFNFTAAGISQGKVILECSHSETAFPKPTGSEPWYIYQPLVDKYDDYTLDVSCRGDASAIDSTTQTMMPITLNWSINTTLVGDRNDKVRSWTNSQSTEIRDVRSL